MKADIKAKLEKRAEDEANMSVDTSLNEQLLANMEGEVPEVMYENRITDMVRDWEYRNRYQGITVKDYLKFANITMEQFRENFKDAATKQINLRLVLEKIAATESITATEEEIEKQYNELAEEHKMDVEKVKSIISAESLAEDIKVEKAFNLVRDNADITVE